jgi:all-trans-retinol dehydrogenase (NAD+)
MIRCALLALVSAILHTRNPKWLHVSSEIGLPSSLLVALYWCFKWSFSLWAIAELNWALNRWADRRWRFTTNKGAWDWKREVAVVTGGSAGIGACVVKKLVARGIKVAVLDVSPLSNVFTKG